MVSEKPAAPTVLLPVPEAISKKILRFLVDKCTGNVVLNIRDGQILKAELQEHVKA